MDSVHDEVTLIPWQESWSTAFGEEKRQIADALTSAEIAAEVLHVGSTSVEGMISKPVIDILVCPDESISLDDAAAALESIGYPVFKGETEAQARRRKIAEEAVENAKAAEPEPSNPHQ